MPPPSNLIGRRFGTLVVTERRPRIIYGGRSVTLWGAVCDCGQAGEYPQTALVSGRVTACPACSRPRCEICGGPFERAGPSQKYHPACAAVARRRQWLAHYYRKVESDPDFNRRRAAAVAAKVDELLREKRRGWSARQRERVRQDPERRERWAAYDREWKRRWRAALTPEEREALRRRQREFWRQRALDELSRITTRLDDAQPPSTPDPTINEEDEMRSLEPMAKPSDPVAVRHLSTDELRQELSRAITMTAHAVAYLAACWTELERRGEDLSGLKIGLAPYLREVAQGRLAPEAVVTFAGQRMVLRWLARQPLEMQQRIASGEPVTVIEPDGTARQVPASDLGAHELRLIQTSQARATRPAEPGQPEPEARRRRGRAPVRTAPRRAITANLDPEEYEEVIRRARESNLTISDLIRQSLGLPLVGANVR